MTLKEFLENELTRHRFDVFTYYEDDYIATERDYNTTGEYVEFDEVILAAERYIADAIETLFGKSE